MPPHCDAKDGPVVRAAILALEAEDVTLVLPYVKADGEEEIRRAFERVVTARKDPDARDLADQWFFETVVRVHRAGEGAPYTGLKPAGLDVGPVIPVAEKAIESGSSGELIQILQDLIGDEVKHRFDRVMDLKRYDGGAVPQAREYVEAMLGLQVWSNKVYKAIQAGPHEEHGVPHKD